MGKFSYQTASHVFACYVGINQFNMSSKLFNMLIDSLTT